MELEINTNNKEEFLGQIIDIFEDFLDDKGIVLDNSEKDGDENLEPEESANIFGSDYDDLHDKLYSLILQWSKNNTEKTQEKNNEPPIHTYVLHRLPKARPEKYLLTLLTYEVTTSHILKAQKNLEDGIVILDLALKSGMGKNRFAAVIVEKGKIALHTVRQFEADAELVQIADAYLAQHPEIIKNSILTESQKLTILDNLNL